MDIQQLKLVLDTVAKLGTDSKEAFFWWVFAKEVFPYLIGLIWAGILGFLARLIVLKISATSEIEQLKNHFGFDTHCSVKTMISFLQRK